MKFLRYLLPLVLFSAASCREDTPIHHFELRIVVWSDGGDYEYKLTDSLLTIEEVSAANDSMRPKQIIKLSVLDNDSIRLIALLDEKSYGCKEQHALNVSYITFTNDSGGVDVDPNVNHPKELDYAVRLINSLVPAQYKLEFVDMQQAIEPDGKMRL